MFAGQQELLIGFYAIPQFLLIPLWIRYQTLRYRFDEEGVSMQWGRLFRREIHLAYARVQDIHLVSNAVERWLGLARIQIQTASGSAKAELTIAGVESHEALRDFLYSRMRGAQQEVAAQETAEPGVPGLSAAAADELTATLQEVAAELRALRLALADRQRSVTDV